ncbi:MAG: hypothetical protein JNL39_03615 [Opitutaceae bacterium]|nr:hypothetical protein [Opitutaceae bacterium]
MRARLFLFAAVLVAGSVRAADAASTKAAGPDLFISLRGVVDGVIEVGEPLFVGVRLEAPFESAKPISLAPASGTWADAIELVLVRGETLLPARATMTTKPASAAVTLDAENAASGEWFFPAEQTARLSPGDYAVQARLALPATGGASEPVSIRVVARSNEAGRAVQRTVALANEALVTGRLQEGVRLVDGLLADQPDHLRLLAVRARLSARAGDLRGAMTCVTRALSTPEVEGLSHPPVGLIEMRNELGRALLASGASSAPPPDWTTLPPRVREVIRPTPTKTKPVARTASTSSALPPSTAPASAGAGAPTHRASAPAASAPAAMSARPPPGPPAPGTIVPTAELDDAKVRADPAGQWAAAASAGSFQKNNYNYYTPARAAGEPKVVYPGYNTEAWCPAQQNTGDDWIELTFAKPTKAAAVRVRQTFNPGAIVKVEAVESDGTAHLWWQGNDPYRRPANREIVWFAVRVPATSYPVAKIRLSLNLAAVPGWKQIDAVQLVAAP